MEHKVHPPPPKFKFIAFAVFLSGLVDIGSLRNICCAETATWTIVIQIGNTLKGDTIMPNKCIKCDTG